MKKLIVTLFFAVIGLVSVTAAETEFEKSMINGIEKLTASSTAEATTEVTNYFVRLSEINKGEGGKGKFVIFLSPSQIPMSRRLYLTLFIIQLKSQKFVCN